MEHNKCKRHTYELPAGTHVLPLGASHGTSTLSYINKFCHVISGFDCNMIYTFGERMYVECFLCIVL